MKTLKILILSIGVLFTFQSYAQKSNLKAELKSIPQIKKVKKYPLVDHFREYYEFWFEQHTDPKDPESPTFLQRCLLGHVSKDKPLIIELEGYNIYTSFAGELAGHYNCNKLTVEHRYFEKSRPKKSIPWRTLTVDNAAHDHHMIIQAMHKIYPKSKFLTTGISKGGQTTMLHRSKYPDDVDASVCYVAPLNFEREDPRIYTFLDTVGTDAEREQVKNFQLLCFQRKPQLLPLLDSLGTANSWTWEMGVDLAYDYYVLEYSFAFWQWGNISFSDIPDNSETNLGILLHLLNCSGVSFFEEEGVDGNQPFFYAALTEMGIYGYETDDFDAYTVQKGIYKFDFAFPEGYDTTFSNTDMIAVRDFVQNDATNMMFIYGGKDTWSATAVQLSEGSEKRNVFKYVLPDGHHATRIKSFPRETKKEIWSIISDWIK